MRWDRVGWDRVGWVHVYGVRLMHVCYENRIGWHGEGSVYELLFCFLI